MGFLAAIPAAIGGLFGSGGAAAAAGTAGAAGAGTTAALGSLAPGFLTGTEAAAGADVAAGALGAGAGAGGMTLGAGLNALSPLLGGLGKVASAGSDLLAKFGDVPLSDVLGDSTIPKDSPLAAVQSGAKLGASLNSLLSGSKSMNLPAPPVLQAQPAATSTPTGMIGGFTPTAKTLADLMFRR